jgi:hypothetical protein
MSQKPSDRWWAGKSTGLSVGKVEFSPRLPNVDTAALAAADAFNKEFGLKLDRIHLGAIIRKAYQTNS